MNEALPSGASVLKLGRFGPAAGQVSGRALLLGSGGQGIARLEDFQMQAGQEFCLFLVRHRRGGEREVLALGQLRGNGNQNYQLPEDTDLVSIDALIVRDQAQGFSYAVLDDWLPDEAMA
ncbi:MAG: hypothetical protein ACAI44_40765 [Candidatus Sericytochromatia bacterium]